MSERRDSQAGLIASEPDASTKGKGKSPKSSPKAGRKNKKDKGKKKGSDNQLAESRGFAHLAVDTGHSSSMEHLDLAGAAPKAKAKAEGEGYKQKATFLSRTARHMMSRYQKKVRYKEGDFDLDLTYITPRCIAMSFPASGVEAIYRNDANDVAAMLQEKHGEAFMIINVAEKSYPSDGLKNQVLDFGWPDHMAPPIDRLLGCIQAMDGWNRSDDANVTVVHCKGGKGRTGVVIAAYMLQVKNFMGAYGADDAMDHFAITRFDSKDPMKYGISGKSQRRYVNYFKDIIEGNFEVYDRQMFLESVTMNLVPDYDGGCCRPSLRISEFPSGDTQLGTIFEWPPDYSHLAVGDRPQTEFTQADKTITIPVNKLIKLGDIAASCGHKPKTDDAKHGHGYHKKKKKKKKKLENMWRVQFHTCSVKDFAIHFNKNELDDTKASDERFTATAMVTFNFCPKRTPTDQEPYNLGAGLRMQFERAPENLLADPSTKTALPELRASKMTLSDADRLEVMSMVKTGKLSVDEAVAQVLAKERQRPVSSVPSRTGSTSDSGTESEGDGEGTAMTYINPFGDGEHSLRTASGPDISVIASDPADEAVEPGSPYNPFGPTPEEQANFQARLSKHRRSKSAITASSFMGKNPFDEPSVDAAEPPARSLSLLDSADDAGGAAVAHRRSGSLDFNTMMNAPILEEAPKAHSRHSSVDFSSLAEKAPSEKPGTKWGAVRTSIISNPFADMSEDNPFGASPSPGSSLSASGHNPFEADGGDAAPEGNPFADSADAATAAPDAANPFCDAVPDATSPAPEAVNPFASDVTQFASDVTSDEAPGASPKSPVPPAESVNPFASDEMSTPPMPPADAINPFASDDAGSTKPPVGDAANPFGDAPADDSAPAKTPTSANPFA